MADGSQLMTIAEQSAHFLDREHGPPPAGPVLGRAAWRAADFKDRSDWVEPFSGELIAAFEAAMAKVEQGGKPLDDLEAADFDLTAFADILARWRRELTHGRGFLVLSGVPVERWTPATQALFMRALGLQFGRLGYQNPRGDVIGEVRDTGADKRDPFARLYATAGEFRFHCDASDLVGLLCVRPAAKGGESKVASSVAVYNELHRRRPDLAALLFEPIPYDLRNEHQPGGQPWAAFAPCAHADGVLKTFYISDYFRTVERLGVALSPAQRELLDLYDEIAGSPEVGLSFFLQPGDVQILYNHTTLHARTAFEDAPGRERLLLRFLVSMDA